MPKTVGLKVVNGHRQLSIFTRDRCNFGSAGGVRVLATTRPMLLSGERCQGRMR
jgi:hypothetical protein